MHKQFQPTINPGDKLIIGLGDSFTQGVGAYTDTTWAKHNGKIDVFVHDHDLLKEQYEGAWVSQLANMMPGWKGINLGHAGTGNRSAVKELYFWNHLGLDQASEAVVVYMLSGLERFDFVNKELNDEHHHFFAMWPNHWDPNASNKKLWEAYSESIYSERFIVSELLLNLLEAQTWCKAHGFRLVVASAFDMRFNRKSILSTLNPMFGEKACVGKEFVDQFDWSTVCYPKKCASFIELLLKLEGNHSMRLGEFYSHYSALEYPSEYITNCAHPTRKGHTVMAQELYKFINK